MARHRSHSIEFKRKIAQSLARHSTVLPNATTSRATSSGSPAITNGRTPRAENSRGTFTARDGSSLLTAAGLWDEWNHRETGERLKFCAMIVGEPNELAAEIHERMPVFLMEDQFAAWLSGGGGSGMLEARAQRLPSTLASIEAGNSSKADADDASLIEPARVTVA